MVSYFIFTMKSNKKKERSDEHQTTDKTPLLPAIYTPCSWRKTAASFEHDVHGGEFSGQFEDWEISER